jgi:hypothetical protein
MSIAQRFSLAGFIAIAASSAHAADLAPAPPAPVEGWTLTLAVGPEVFTSFPGAKSVSIWPTGYISYRRPGEPEPFVSLRPNDIAPMNTVSRLSSDILIILLSGSGSPSFGASSTRVWTTS